MPAATKKFIHTPSLSALNLWVIPPFDLPTESFRNVVRAGLTEGAVAPQTWRVA
jgi:hypothetical protein